MRRMTVARVGMGRPAAKKVSFPPYHESAPAKLSLMAGRIEPAPVTYLLGCLFCFMVVAGPVKLGHEASLEVTLMNERHVTVVSFYNHAVILMYLQETSQFPSAEMISKPS